MKTLSRILVLLLLCSVPAVLMGYGTRVHRLLPGRTLGTLATPLGGTVARQLLPPARPADLEAFRAWLWTRAARLSDTTLRRAFLRRFPDASAFDAHGFKEFLMMDGAAVVLGVDTLPTQPLSVQGALELGSVYPDLDLRNQSRLLRGPGGGARLTVRGDSVPFDPMSLNMGRLTGLSSQAHAHLGLSLDPKSSDPAVLKTEPWNFAIATGFDAPVQAFAADNAQIYTDLALLAALEGRPAWRTVSILHAGSAMHYVADVGNAIHTVQVGIYPIFVDATVQSMLRRALKLFGLFGESPTRNAIGLNIITNLHTMSERLYEMELGAALAVARGSSGDTSIRPSMHLSLDALERGDDSLARVLRPLLAGGAPEFGRIIAQAVIDANVRDGAEVYRVTRSIIDTRLRVGRIAMDFDTVPDQELWTWLRVKQDDRVRTELDDFNEVHARGLARTTTALRAWWDQYLAAAAAPAPSRAPLIESVLARLVSSRLRYLEAAEARRAAWIGQHGGALR